MQRLESMLNEIFDTRINDIATVTKEEQEKINNSKIEISIEEFFSNVTDEEAYKIQEYTELVRESMTYEMGFFEEKYYKTGFADAVKLVMECLKL